MDDQAADPSRADFENCSHEQLLAMIRHADPGTIESVGDHLGRAVEDIARIGAYLDRHIAYVDWEGASGVAFRDWGSKVARATFGLSDYARSTAKALTHAADTLRTVTRDMPPVPAAARSTFTGLGNDPTVRHDPDAQALMAHAHAEMEAARIEAADQMRKLAQAYSLSATVMNTAEAPEYPPMPSPFVPPAGRARPIGVAYDDAVTSPGEPPHVRGAVAASLSDAAGHASEAPPLTRTQSADVPVPAGSDPRPSGSAPFGDGLHTGSPAPPGGYVAPSLTSGPFVHRSGDVEASGTGWQLSRKIPRQKQPRGAYEPFPDASPTRAGHNHGIVGGSPVDEPAASGNPAQGVAAYGVVGGYGPPTRPPAVGTVSGHGAGRPASGATEARRLAAEPGGVVGPAPAAVFAPRVLGTTGTTGDRGEERDGTERADGPLGMGDWGPRRDDVAPPVIR
ncbi:hypothetical protein [Streptomyces sp. NPDC021224]|uniref:WXG100 family type VII secretion target n=1 Tax=unclassified Streptomyces TaxID=2593676 RepID=UPI0037954B85